MYHETLPVEVFLLTCQKTLLVRRLLGITRKSRREREALLGKDSVMDCKQLANLIVTGVSLHILLMTLNCEYSQVQEKQTQRLFRV